ncbi:MAG: hypothetical protein JWQ04_2314, partial [Pedosphaera sp.]|nr:hypothetical protein [Pedosphaera sp.]
MLRTPFRAIALALLAGGLNLCAQTGPFSPTNWPPTINTNLTIDYLITDPKAVFASTPSSWVSTISFAGGGDQAYSPITLDGLLGDQSSSANMNIA